MREVQLERQRHREALNLLAGQRAAHLAGGDGEQVRQADEVLPRRPKGIREAGR